MVTFAPSRMRYTTNCVEGSSSGTNLGRGCPNKTYCESGDQWIPQMILCCGIRMRRSVVCGSTMCASDSGERKAIHFPSGDHVGFDPLPVGASLSIGHCKCRSAPENHRQVCCHQVTK